MGKKNTTKICAIFIGIKDIWGEGGRIIYSIPWQDVQKNFSYSDLKERK